MCLFCSEDKIRAALNKLKVNKNSFLQPQFQKQNISLVYKQRVSYNPSFQSRSFPYFIKIRFLQPQFPKQNILLVYKKISFLQPQFPKQNIPLVYKNQFPKTPISKAEHSPSL
jgi:hypothetical protein